MTKSARGLPWSRLAGYGSLYREIGSNENALRGQDVEDVDELDISGIAQYLSDLSQDGRLPAGAGPANPFGPFLPDDVDFRSNDWLRRTLAVQGWMGLDDSVDMQLPFSASATKLMELISPDPPETCLIASDEKVSLTDIGAQHLDTWLSRAVAHRESFQEALEDGRSHAEASDDWLLLWSESTSLAQHPAIIKAVVKTLPIKSFVDYAEEDQLDLNPSYQRDSVWSVGDSQKLIDSILRGIPIPSIILTKGEEGEEGEELQIVDGKQRLTAILRFIGQHPAARQFALSKGNIDEFDSDHKKFIRKHHLKSKDIAEHYLPFRTGHYPPGDPLHVVSRKLYSEIKDLRIQSGQGNVAVKSIFQSALTPYHIPVIIYERTRLQDIHHVFSIYNKQGRKLNAEELRNATFHHLGLTKLLLVLSGDRRAPKELAPYLPPDVMDSIEEVGDSLRDLGFGTMRFKRTKVLSWTCGIFLHGPNGARDGTFATPSTASHIDSMLRSISEKKGYHPLFQNNTLVALARDVKAAVALHSDVENAWAPRFRSKRGTTSRWEELPLVASLLTCLILVSIDKEELLKQQVESIRKLAEASPGLPNAQNKTQWKWISRFVVAALRQLGVDLASTETVLKDRYGYSCIAVLASLAKNPAPDAA